MKYLNSIAILIFVTVFSCKPKSSVSNEENPVSEMPNIIVILTDDQGYADLSCYGAKGFSTPNIDALANSGVRFTNFYVPQPVCSASRAGLLTGCYPNRIGVHGAFVPNAVKGLNPNETTLAELVKQKDYATAIYGKWHLGDAKKFLPTNHGFDEFYGIPYSNDMWPNHPWQGTIFDFPPLPLIENETVIDTLEDQQFLTKALTQKSLSFIEKNQDKPFFLYLAHPQPHVPLFAGKEYIGTTERGLYGDVISEIDWSVGEIMKKLESLDLRKNTLVIFTSDNGPWLAYGDHAGSADPLREGKQTTWEGGVRVPGILSYPEQIPAGMVSDVPIMTIDLLPTIAGLIGLDLPENTIDGKDVWPIITGKSSKNPHDAYYFYFGTNELQAIRSDEWKLVFPHKYVSLDGQPGGKDGLPAKTTRLEITKPMLYNMEEDMGETKDLSAEYPEIVEKLTNLANQKRQEIGDALTKIEGNDNRPIGTIN